MADVTRVAPRQTPREGILYVDARGRLWRVHPETVRADECRYEADRRADRRALDRSLGVDPFRGKYPGDR